MNRAVFFLVYRQYLATPAWAALRYAALVKSGYRCQRCGACATTLQVHHLRYRKPLHKTRESDVIVLCKSCHQKVHRRLF